MTTWRTFAALELPTAIRHALAKAQNELKVSSGSQAIRWTAPEQIHLTIKFYGEVEQKKIDDLAQTLEACCAAFSPFSLSLNQLGCFPNPRKPRIIWAGLQDSSHQLAALAASVEQASSKLGFITESRPFQPHLTIGRAKRDARIETLAAFGALLQKTHLEPLEWIAESLTLFRSVLTPAGPIYTVLAQAPLANKGTGDTHAV